MQPEACSGPGSCGDCRQRERDFGDLRKALICSAERDFGGPGSGAGSISPAERVFLTDLALGQVLISPAEGDAGAGRQPQKMWNWRQSQTIGDFRPSLTFVMADQEYSH